MASNAGKLDPKEKLETLIKDIKGTGNSFKELVKTLEDINKLIGKPEAKEELETLIEEIERRGTSFNWLVKRLEDINDLIEREKASSSRPFESFVNKGKDKGTRNVKSGK